MKMWAGKVLAFAAACACGAAVPAANAQELSEKAVNSFMEYAWGLTPQQFSRPDGTTILIDKKKRDDVVVPVDVAREVIRVGRLSAHAQVCELTEDQVSNHRSLMMREEAKKKWTPQQMVYINQLHLTTVMLLTGKIRLVEKDGDKEVKVVEEGKAPQNTCTAEQKAKVKELITAYVASGPQPKSPAAAAAAVAAEKKGAPQPEAGTPAAQAAPESTGSTAAPAAAPAAGAAPAAKTPAAAPAAPAAAPPKK